MVLADIIEDAGKSGKDLNREGVQASFRESKSVKLMP